MSEKQQPTENDKHVNEKEPNCAFLFNEKEPSGGFTSNGPTSNRSLIAFIVYLALLLDNILLTVIGK